MKEYDKAIQGLKRAAKETDALLRRLSDTSDKMGKKSSSTLFGTTGGLLGALLGIGLAHYTGISLITISTPLTGLGILGGILLYRGRRQFRLEKRMAENRLAADEILDRIKSLPKNAPEIVKNELWNTYRQINRGYQSQTAVLLAPSQKESNALLLPQPTDSKDEDES